MDTLHDRLAELADDAPTGGAPAAELWARGKRAHRLRAAAVAATLLVVGAVGTGVGVRLADGDGNRSGPAPAGTVGITLPIEYPVAEELPDLGDTPGPLAAIWLERAGGGVPEAVGLVAETGTFGTLPIGESFYREGNFGVPQLSPDGRRIAYGSGKGDLIVHDLVSGENYSPASEFKTRVGYTWVDATHLLGHVWGGTDGDGWLWEPGTATAPKLVNPYLVPYSGTDLSVLMQGLPPRCTSPILQNVETLKENGGEGSAGSFEVPVLCDLLGIIPGSEIVLGHWNSDRLTVIALQIRGADAPFEDPAVRRVVVTADAPEQVSLATNLIGAALDADGGAS